MGYNNYDEFADGYASDNEKTPFNTLYERPAILALAGDVRGCRVLDAGCGAGGHAAALIGRAAVVTGVDLSTNMLRIARHRVGPDVALHHADLRAPLPFDDHAFDLVLSSLVMHYLPAWEPTLDEFHRLLVPHGRLVLSTRHPFADQRINGTDDYFGTYAFTDTWIRNGRRMPMRFWHRPLRAMLAAFHSTGFIVDDIAEPDPQPAMASIDPITYRRLSRTPQFIFFALTSR
ncbi:methyltransferase [Nocardia terpenica]|uniref:Methyltransferase n=1 Tax=Nocardia terpenica TaxID=455432 RepID=A0A164IW37_9NOCA|nr:methyltransferase [Nocardia terpenica]NQE89450.1 class I SAM-dependent methyltransferase [Nocardia terpenica]